MCCSLRNSLRSQSNADVDDKGITWNFFGFVSIVRHLVFFRCSSFCFFSLCCSVQCFIPSHPFGHFSCFSLNCQVSGAHEALTKATFLAYEMMFNWMVHNMQTQRDTNNSSKFDEWSGTKRKLVNINCETCHRWLEAIVGGIWLRLECALHSGFCRTPTVNIIIIELSFNFAINHFGWVFATRFQSNMSRYRSWYYVNWIYNLHAYLQFSGIAWIYSRYVSLTYLNDICGWNSLELHKPTKIHRKMPACLNSTHRKQVENVIAGGPALIALRTATLNALIAISKLRIISQTQRTFYMPVTVQPIHSLAHLRHSLELVSLASYNSTNLSISFFRWIVCIVSSSWACSESNEMNRRKQCAHTPNNVVEAAREREKWM